MSVEEYTENTNTGVLHPPKDHSFENLKGFAGTFWQTLTRGQLVWLFAFFCLFSASFLFVESQSLTYESRPSFQIENPSLKIASQLQNMLADAEFHNSFLNQQPVLEALQAPLPTSYSTLATWHLSAVLFPVPYKVSSKDLSLGQERIASALKSATVSAETLKIQATETSPQLLSAVMATLPSRANLWLEKKGAISRLSEPAVTATISARTFLSARKQTLWFILGFSALVGFVISYFLVEDALKNEQKDLRLTFPFPILGMLPEKDDNQSPTIANDAFELLRTNVSMQRSVFSFSSLTLIWPFERDNQEEFINRIATDYSKMAKKVLVIETASNTSREKLGLTDLHYLIKESKPHSEEENDIFWKLYEYVSGTPDKFYVMSYGRANVAEEILFEKYNFRRILNLLKKHFSLVILNCPEHVDPSQTLPWTTISDATLIVANYRKHNRVGLKDQLKDIACSQRFLLGGVLTDVPVEETQAEILNYTDLKVQKLAS